MASIDRDRGLGARLFGFINGIALILFSVMVLYPFLYLIRLSVNPGDSYNISTLSLIPQSVDFGAYGKVFRNPYILNGFLVTLSRVLIGTPLTLLVTIMCAYALSKRYLPGRGYWTAFFAFTMFFDAGLMPTYLNINNLGLMNNFWVLIIPRMMYTYDMVIARNYFMSLPESIEESARIDGAGDYRILFQIVVPVSAPIIATVALWTIVFHWNSYFDAMIYIRDTNLQVLQVILRRIILENTTQMIDLIGYLDDTSTNPENLKAASVIVTTLPIICAYPFLQKYFVKGVLVGSLKG